MSERFTRPIRRDHMNKIKDALDERVRIVEIVRRDLLPNIQRAAVFLVNCLRSGGRIFWCGNGVSAADSQHLAAELIGRFKRERRPIASLALTTDTSVLTCIGNDYSFNEIFSRQVEALVVPGDVLVCLSTSGRSENVLRAVEVARQKGARILGLLGRDGGTIGPRCDLTIVVPADDTARIQEMHITLGHILCDLLEEEVLRS